MIKAHLWKKKKGEAGIKLKKVVVKGNRATGIYRVTEVYEDIPPKDQTFITFVIFNKSFTIRIK